MANLLLLEFRCPEVSRRPIMCQIVDLDQVVGDRVTVTIDRELAEAIRG